MLGHESIDDNLEPRSPVRERSTPVLVRDDDLVLEWSFPWSRMKVRMECSFGWAVSRGKSGRSNQREAMPGNLCVVTVAMELQQS